MKTLICIHVQQCRWDVFGSNFKCILFASMTTFFVPLLFSIFFYFLLDELGKIKMVKDKLVSPEVKIHPVDFLCN